LDEQVKADEMGRNVLRVAETRTEIYPKKLKGGDRIGDLGVIWKVMLHVFFGKLGSGVVDWIKRD
jgi:hypothetical protein